MNALRRIRSSSLAVLVFCSFSAGALGDMRIARAQDAPPTTASGPAPAALETNPKDVKLTVRTKDGKTQFRLGEVVRLVLEITTSTRDTYNISGASYDRSGRLNGTDVYRVSPEAGTSDPLEEYFESGIGLYMTGGLSSFGPLGAKPFTLERDLNEWVRFDRPGRYTIDVASNRISRVHRGASGDRELRPVRLTSNTIDIEVSAASPAWQESELRRIVKALDGRDEKVRDAARTDLRFLGTKAAAVEMARRSALGEWWLLGLAGSPERAAGVREMERLLESPGAGISPTFLSHLTLFACYEQMGGPLARLEHWDDAMLEERAREVERRRALAAHVRSTYGKRLAAALPAKKRAARALSLQTLVELGGTDADPPLRAALVAAFVELPVASQRQLLAYKWDHVAGREMLPALRKLHEALPDSDEETRSAVLERLIALDPEGGRELALAEIRRPDPRVAVSAFFKLPDETLPALDELLGARLTDDEEASFSQVADTAVLVARFGSPALLPRVAAFYDGRAGAGDCDSQAFLLAYIARVDPVGGAARLRAAQTARNPDPCFASALDRVAKLSMCPEVEQIAVEALDDSDPSVAAKAAATLGAYGSADAEAHLWKRLEALNAQWRGKLPLPDYGPRPDHEAARAMDRGLSEALGNARSWALDSEGYDRLASLRLTPLGKEAALRGARDTADGVRVWYTPLRSAWGEARVDNHSCDSLSTTQKRFIQYPRGTLFVWAQESSPKADAVFAEMSEWLEANGMKMVRSGVSP